MTKKRIRALGANGSLAMAVALSVGLAGCTPSHFDANSPAANPAAAGANTSTSTTTVTPPNQTGTTPAAKSVIALDGSMKLPDGPMANAALTVVDAVSKQPLPLVDVAASNIISSGAGNDRHLAQANASTKYQTNADGSFKLSIQGLDPNSAALVSATKDGKTISCLVGGDGTVLDRNAGSTAKYELAATGSTKLTGDAASTAMVHLLNALLGTHSGLSSNAQRAMDTAIRRLADAALAIANTVDTNPALANQELTTGTDDTNVINALKQSDSTKKALQNSVAALVADFRNLGILDNGGLNNPILAAIGVSVGTNGNILVDGQPTTSTTPPPAVLVQNDNNSGATLSNGLDDAPTVGQVKSDSSAFKPNMKVYNGTPAGSTTIDVAQTSGQEDIGKIIARFSGTSIFTSATQIATGTTDDTAALPIGAGTKTLTVDQSSTGTFPNTPLDSTLGSGTLTAGDTATQKWQGYLNNSTKQVAYVQVFESAGYTYLVMTYAMSTTDSTNVQAHNTRLTTTSVNLAGGGNVNVVAYSRLGHTAKALLALTSGTVPTPFTTTF